jgi:hypothetical protein
MKTEWKNMDPFKRHVEEMASFRRAHAQLGPVQPARPDGRFSGPRPFVDSLHDEPENLFNDERGRVIVVPIWDVEVPRDSQN